MVQNFVSQKLAEPVKKKRFNKFLKGKASTQRMQAKPQVSKSVSRVYPQDNVNYDMFFRRTMVMSDRSQQRPKSVELKKFNYLKAKKSVDIESSKTMSPQLGLSEHTNLHTLKQDLHSQRMRNADQRKQITQLQQALVLKEKEQ